MVKPAWPKLRPIKVNTKKHCQTKNLIHNNETSVLTYNVLIIHFLSKFDLKELPVALNLAGAS